MEASIGHDFAEVGRDRPRIAPDVGIVRERPGTGTGGRGPVGDQRPALAGPALTRRSTIRSHSSGKQIQVDRSWTATRCASSP